MTRSTSRTVSTVRARHERILESEVCFVGETPWRSMKNRATKRWWVWALSNGPRAYHRIVPRRGTAAARELLRDFSRMLMADDAAVHRSLEKERTRLGGVQRALGEDGKLVDLPTPDHVLATCWMHARRYLLKAERYHPETGEALDLI